MTDKKKSFLAIFLLLAISMRVVSGPTANLSYLLLAAFALLGRPHAIVALALSWFFSMLSPGIAAPATLASVGRYAVIFGAALSVLARSGMLSGRFYVSTPVAAILGMGILLIFHSTVVSPMPDVSILKIVSWTLVFATLVSAWQQLSWEERDNLSRQIFSGLIVIMVVSLPLLVLPLGYLRNGSGFQGILNHPQALGPTMALLGTWAGSQLFAQRKPSWFSIALVAISLLLVLLSEARTAGLAMVLGVSVAVLSAPVLAGKPLRVLMPGLRSKRIWTVLTATFIVAVAFAPRIINAVEHYITKSGRAGEVQSLLEAYDRSRGGLIDEMWVNITQHPLTGIGFGIASNPQEMFVERDPVLGLPVSASIEKGVLPVAILEELGVPLAILVALLFWALLRRGARNGVTPLAVTTTVLLLNMGESTFFSPGGLGLLPLVLIGWAATQSRVTEPRSDTSTIQVTSFQRVSY
ncbi:hypothetical protein [Orrella marina]|uniref:O-antigen ligase domain-containing protein n=1 Tax=Orrella marina TaxID=2163011 RepID=A0A2R4XGW7_9BURK|nr:hypothetical protein [Orrella marina]AWB33031.1 hypothetical protein DBV39_04075 [Orrella marina]